MAILKDEDLFFFFLLCGNENVSRTVGQNEGFVCEKEYYLIKGWGI